VQSRERLAAVIDELMNRGTQIVLVTHRLAEIVPSITHILGVSNGQIMFHGKRKEVLSDETLTKLYLATPINLSRLPHVPEAGTNHNKQLPKRLVSLHGVCVSYGQTRVLDNLNWTLHCGENWAIVGPNGSGKTTLLSLIVGDNPQAYRNRIYLFGKRRGSGESIWEIKDKIGFISSEFQIRYRKDMTAFEVVLSGYFDSVGLYRHSSPAQKDIARQWIELLGIGDRADKRFNTLSYGQQRLTLLARAMVKSPPLLVLDEPCQGLDRPTRQEMMALLNYIGRRTTSSLIYVSHHQQERPACITHVLRFIRTRSGSYHAVQEKMTS
jgi:molybdate transport system ATP-binding protein